MYTLTCAGVGPYPYSHPYLQCMHELIKHSYIRMYLSMDEVSGSTLTRSIKIYDHLWPLLTGEKDICQRSVQPTAY